MVEVTTRVDFLPDAAARMADLGSFSGLHDVDDPLFFDRELSWLRFNARVLQEAAWPETPLAERLLFLSIFSSNLDEFFRVRVASVRSILLIKKKQRKKLLELRPNRLLKRIKSEVAAQQEEFGRIFRDEVIPELHRRGVELVRGEDLTASEVDRVDRYFTGQVLPLLETVELDGVEVPFVGARAVHLVVETVEPRTAEESVLVGIPETRLSLLELPSPPLPRFFSVEPDGGPGRVMFLDDVVRSGLVRLFPGREVRGAWAMKLSRDADLYLEEELGTDLKELIRQALDKRSRGMPVRFQYDLHAPAALVSRVQELLGLDDRDLIEGGRYHNLRDLSSLPLPDDPGLRFEPMLPLAHPELEDRRSMFDAVAERDRLLRFPYQSFGYVIRFLREAAEDPLVDEIWISLYRVASDSAVGQVLIEAATRGLDVKVFVEFQARFDEKSNLEWADRLEAAGVRIIYGVQGIKVHAKIAMVRRREGGRLRDYAYLSTGNFNERTARTYADHALLTADTRLTDEVYRVFRILAGESDETHFDHLLVAPFNLRERLNEFIADELSAALIGDESGITLKVNSLQDHPIIERIYGAVQAGVPVRMIVRGICCARPGVSNLSEGLEIRSIVDRFLEHSRIYRFHAGGEDRLYLASADWMSRNLNRRVEVAFPIYDESVRRALREELEIQFADDTRARVIDDAQSNAMVTRGDGPPVRAQYAVYERLKESAEGG